MTIPEERYRAIFKARDFLRDLLDPKKTPKVPKAIRTEAYWCLRHFPWDLHIEQIAKKIPEHFSAGKNWEEEVQWQTANIARATQRKTKRAATAKKKSNKKKRGK